MNPIIQKHFRRKQIQVGFVKAMPRKGVETIEEFLARGGEVEVIPIGVSGEDPLTGIKGTAHLRGKW